MATKRQIWLNKKMGYREDYDGLTVRKFINEYVKRYLVHWYHTHDKVPTRRQKKGPRGGYTGVYIDVPAPAKKTTETFAITFFWFTPIAFKFQFEWHTYIFFQARLSFAILKPNLMFTFEFKRNSA